MSEQHPGKAALDLAASQYRKAWDESTAPRISAQGLLDAITYVSDLESRLEKAEAERDATLEAAAQEARLAIHKTANKPFRTKSCGIPRDPYSTDYAQAVVAAIRALKSPIPDQGGER